MIAYFLIPLYTILSIFAIHLIIRKKSINLSFIQTSSAFTYKVAFGILYGYVFMHYYRGDDTWMYYGESLSEYDKLLSHTSLFFRELVPVSSFTETPGFLEALRTFFQDFEHRFITKSLALFNLITFKDYYTDVVLFNFLAFWGQYFIYKLFASVQPDRKNLFFAIAFFFPSIAFWLSGIRGDGLLVVCISAAFYYFYCWLEKSKPKYLLLSIVSIAGILIFRPQLFLLVIPSFSAWAIAQKFNYSSLKVFGITLIITIAIFFGSIYIIPSHSFPKAIAERQMEFFQLKGNTVYKLDKLQPDLISYTKVLPQAFCNSFLRPFLWEVKGPLQILSAIENLVFLVFFVLWIIQARKNKLHPVYAAALFFSISLYLLIGYVIPFPGAIVRYKIPAELLFLMVFISWVNFKLEKN